MTNTYVIAEQKWKIELTLDDGVSVASRVNPVCVAYTTPHTTKCGALVDVVA